MLVDERLVERGLGVLQGLTAEEVRRDHPEAWTCWKKQQNFPAYADVEPDSVVVARVEDTLFALADMYPGQAVAIVGHGAALRSMMMQAVGTASISELSVGPGRSWKVVRVGDERHLTGMRGMGFYRDADSSEWGEDLSATTVLLCRHGETNWNLERKFQGTLDTPLNERGQQQAHLITKALESKNIVAVYTSPLQRARATAEVISSSLKVEMQVDERLTERNLGVMQGRNPTVLWNEFPKVIEAWVEQVPLPSEAEAEPSGEVITRIENAMYDMAMGHPGKTVALILHGASIRCLLKRAVGNARITTPKNVSLTTMLVGPGKKWRVSQWADVSHMPKLTKEELKLKLQRLSKL